MTKEKSKKLVLFCTYISVASWILWAVKGINRMAWLQRFTLAHCSQEWLRESFVGGVGFFQVLKRPNPVCLLVLICCLLFYGMWKHLFLIILQLVCSKNNTSTSPLKLRITDFRRRDFTQRFTWLIVDQLKSLSYVKSFVYMPSAFKNSLIYSKEPCDQYML